MVGWAVSGFGDLDARWAWKDELLARFAPPLERLGRGRRSPSELEGLLRSAGVAAVNLTIERLDVAYVDAGAWWAEQWTYGARQALERMDAQALASYRAAAFAAVEACREADGRLHWRPEVAYAVATA